jgi:hypothetical protein
MIYLYHRSCRFGAAPRPIGDKSPRHKDEFAPEIELMREIANSSSNNSQTYRHPETLWTAFTVDREQISTTNIDGHHMQPPTQNSTTPGQSRLLTASFLIVFFCLLHMALRIAQKNEIMAVGAVWVANALTMVLHVIYWKRYGLSVGFKIAVVVQIVITILPFLFGNLGFLAVLLMLGGEIYY